MGEDVGGTVRPTTVTLDIEVIEQWLDWLDNICTGESDDLLRTDLTEVLVHPERCQPYTQSDRSDG